MDLEHYRNFILIVESGSLTRAAEVIHIAQPALSGQLKILEKQYGTRLILTHRGSRKLMLTDAGRILYQRAKYFCALEEAMQYEISNCVRGISGTLRISFSPSRALSFIHKILREFSRLYPDVSYELYEGSIEEQTRQLLHGVSEIGVVNAPLCQPERFEILHTREERLAAVFCRDIDWAGKDAPQLTLDLLVHAPLHLSVGCLTLFRGVCRNSQLLPQILSVNTTKVAAIQWAKEKAGVAVVPMEEDETPGGALCCREIEDDRLRIHKTIVKVKDRALSPVAQKLLDFYAKSRR